VRDWNVLVTVRDRGWGKALRLLRPLGEVAETHYYNVLLLRVEQPRRLLDTLLERAAADPAALECLARVAPADGSFEFQTREEFEARASDALRAMAPRLAGKSFHVRLHRRGFKGRISGQAEERALSALLLEELRAAGTPARIAFEDPDAVVAVETVGTQAGVSLWTREDLRRYPFLRPG